MANKDNKVAKLELQMFESQDFNKVFEIQKELQLRLGTNFDDMTLKEITDFFFKNSHAMQDEVSEMFDAVGGIENGIGSAAWKWWKKDHDKAHSMTLNDLYEDDLLELKYEAIDMLHFAFNYCLALKMTGSEVFSMYLAKNKENFDRQDRGY